MMTFSRVHIWLAVSASCAFFAFTLQQSVGRPQAPGKPGEADDTIFVETIIETGFVRGVDDLIIDSSFPQPMQIVSVIEDMSQVSEGEVILRVDDSAQLSALAESRTRLATAQNSLAASMTEVESLARQLTAVQNLSELTTKLGQALLAAAESEADAVSARKTLLTERMARAEKIRTLYLEAAKTDRFEDLPSLEQLQIQSVILTAETELADLREQISAISKSSIEIPVLEATVRFEEMQLDRMQQIDALRSRLTLAKSSTEAGTLEQQAAAEAFERAEKAVAACSVRAPRAGLLVHMTPRSSGRSEPVLLEPGQRIPTGAKLFEMPDPERFEVAGTLNEAKSLRVRVGQPVIVEPDAMPGLQLSGRVKSIEAKASPGAWPSTDIREFPFVVQFDPESEAKATESLKHGLTCHIRIDLRGK